MSHDAHAHHEPGFIGKYIFSYDHKMIAKQYLLTGLIMALFGGLLAYGIRTQLAFPGSDIPHHGKVTPDQYNMFITMHGTIMIFWVAMPILIGAFGNFLIPLMIGADDMAFPFLNMLSYWVFFLSTVILILSFYVPGGAAAGGWVAYPPLSIEGIANSANVPLKDFPFFLQWLINAGIGSTKTQWGQVFWVVAVALEFVSILIGGINYITTPLTMRAPGMKLMQMPMIVWMEVIASLLFMLSVGPLVGGAVLMLMDLLAGTGVYLPAKGGDPMLWQHLFWFFGHPEVYVVMLPALGIACEAITCFARKPLFGYRMMVYAVFAAGILSFIVWAHHQFLSISPSMAVPFSLTTILISVPFAIFIFGMIATLWGGSIELTAAMLFGIGLVAEFLIGGVTGIWLGTAATDIALHGTYYVVGHFHYTLFPAVFYGMFCGLYFWWPKMFGRHLDETLGKVHFWGTTVFFNFIFIPMLLIGIAGQPRRYVEPLAQQMNHPQQWLHIISTFGLYGLLFFQLPFVINFFKGLVGAKNAERNPWKANSMEWVAPSPPGHGNFESQPICHHGPYEYSKPGLAEDYSPQWKPEGAVA